MHSYRATLVAASVTILVLVSGLLSGCVSTTHQLDSWNDTDARERIVEFVDRVTTPGSPDFVPEPERIAVFDNDGCLWAEQPMYFQLLFAIDRVRDMADDHAEWKTTQPFQAVLEGDSEALRASGHDGVKRLIAATHAGMTTAEFDQAVRQWWRTARHPTTNRRYSEMIYQPMTELLAYLRANGFKTFIVSGGGIDFMRVFTEEAYGIPPEQVVGSSIKTEFVMTDTGPEIRRLAVVDFVDDKAGKPVGIQRHIGRRPVAAFGNSDGDLQMLQWTHAGDGARLCVLIHHTDANREWAYDRESAVGKLDAALDEAGREGWLVVDMQNDWSQVFPKP